MGLVSKLFAKPKKKKKKNQPATKDTSGQASDISSRFLNNDLSKNLQTILNTTGNSADIIIRQIDLADDPPIKAALVMVDGMIIRYKKLFLLKKASIILKKNYFLLRMSLPYMIGTIYLENYYQEKPLSLLMV